MRTKLLFTALLTTALAFAQDPAVINDGFEKIPKNPGSSDCSCTGWINKDLGDQAESSTNSGASGTSGAIKFDGQEADAMYQEFEVIANTDYVINYNYQFKNDSGFGGIDEPPLAGVDSELELRILKGSAYDSGYTILYQDPSDLDSYRSSGFGYETIADVENAANNLIPVVIKTNPGNSDWHDASINFNSGSETSIAIFGRGIGLDIAPIDGKSYDWSNADQEIRLDFLVTTNATELSTNDVLASNLKIYPNPAQDYIQIDTNNINVSSVEMFSLVGQKVISGKKLINSKLNISSLNRGIYLLKVNTENGSLTKKILVD